MNALHIKPNSSVTGSLHPPPHQFRNPLLSLDILFVIAFAVYSIRRKSRHPAESPPVSQLDSSDAKKTAMSATSSGRPMRPSGIFPILAFSELFPLPKLAKVPAPVRSPQSKGQIQFTHILMSVIQRHRFRQNVTPPFDAQYAARSFIPTNPSTEPTFTIAPPPRFAKLRQRRSRHQERPLHITVINLSHCSSLDRPRSVDTCRTPHCSPAHSVRPNFPPSPSPLARHPLPSQRRSQSPTLRLPAF